MTTLPRKTTFSALRHRNYRLFWIGNIISNTGDWLDQVALGWFVISTTGSPIMLGLVNLGRGLPIILFTMIGGVVADKIDRRRMMMVTQTAAMVLAALLAVTVYAGGHILIIVALATARGIVMSFNLPARHSLIYDLVPREDLPSAIALNSVTANMAKIAGPLASAGIIALFGITACFVVNAATFMAVLAMLFLIDLPRKAVSLAPPESFVRSLTEGVRYLRTEPTMLLLVLVALVPTFFCQPYLHILPLFASDVFAIGPSGLGIMVAVAASGSICGGLLAARLQRDSRRGSTMLMFMGGFALGLVLFAISPSVLLAMPLLFFAGGMHIAYNSSNNTILQLAVDDAYRGRVLSMLFMTRGLVPLGTAAMATLAALTDTRSAMALMASVVVIFAAALWVYAPRLRQMRV